MEINAVLLRAELEAIIEAHLRVRFGDALSPKSEVRFGGDYSHERLPATLTVVISEPSPPRLPDGSAS